MKKLMFLFSVLFIFIWTKTALGDVIYLKNGDKITGQIVDQTDEEMTVRTEAMGDITIVKDFVKPQEDDIAMGSVPQDKIKWSKKIGLGYSQAGGNTDKSSGKASLSFNRKTESDEWTIKGNAYYASANKRMDAKKFYGMLRYAYSFGRNLKWYNFYKVEGDQDRFANIDYRIVPSLGVGYWFLDKERFKAMSELAVGFEHTNFRDSMKSENEAILVPRVFLEKTLLEDLVLSQDVTIYPSLKDTGEFRLHSETSLVHPINEHLSWKVSFIDDFNSDPTGTTKRNDYRLISGVDYNF